MSEEHKRREVLEKFSKTNPAAYQKVFGKQQSKPNGGNQVASPAPVTEIDAAEITLLAASEMPEPPPYVASKATKEELLPSEPVAEKPAAAKDDHGIAEDLLGLLDRFIVATEFALHLITMWILHTHAVLIAGASYTPYLVITSVEKASGKTRVLEVTKPLIRSPLMTASISPAALGRIVDEKKCTLLCDEYDTYFSRNANKELGETVRAILNSGFQIAGTYTRMVGVGANMWPKNFSTFGPKALAGIGQLPDTIASRSIIIRLKRAQPGQCESFRPDGMGQASKALHNELEKLHNRAARWASRQATKIATSEPAIPAQFTDRQADISEPLLAIAKVLGGPWPVRITNALSTIFASPAAEDTSKRVLLLSHIRKIFTDKDKSQLRTEELIEGLCALPEAPWAEWNRGKNITPYGLAKLLREFEIGPRTIRDPVPVRGYVLVSFMDAFSRYLSPICLCPGCDCHMACSGSCSGLCSGLSANDDAGCSSVADFSGSERESEEEKASKTVN